MKVNAIAIKQGVHDGAYEIVWHNGYYIDERKAAEQKKRGWFQCGISFAAESLTA